jgi:hypothetical protein
MSASGWIYPDGTRCQTGSSSSQYGRNTNGIKMATLCLSGRCEVYKMTICYCDQFKLQHISFKGIFV